MSGMGSHDGTVRVLFMRGRAIFAGMFLSLLQIPMFLEFGQSLHSPAVILSSSTHIPFPSIVQALFDPHASFSIVAHSIFSFSIASIRRLSCPEISFHIILRQDIPIPRSGCASQVPTREGEFGFKIPLFGSFRVPVSFKRKW